MTEASAVTLTIPIPFIEGVVVGGAAVGLVMVLLVSFGHWHVYLGWLTPARAAGMRRFAKLVFFPVLGVVVTNAGAWATTAFLHLAVNPDIANAGGLLVGAAVGGVHQGLTWQDPNAAPSPAVPIPPQVTSTPVVEPSTGPVLPQ
jgi:hypothetical protein